MTTVRLYFDNERVGQKFERSVTRQAARVRNAARAAAFDASEEIRKRAAIDMASAGNFGPRWTGGLNIDITEGGGNIRMAFSHNVPYFSVFQYGKTIYGKPLLWIPLSFAPDAKGVLARNFPGGLFRVDRKDPSKAPLLLSRQTREPKYFGKEKVTIPKKFHVIEIIRDVSKSVRDYFLRNYRQGE
jgi:hypothetical protein